MKASHNSYMFGSYAKQITYDPRYPQDGGCLAVEIDLVQNPHKIKNDQEWEFAAEHYDQGGYKSNILKMKTILQELLEWQNERKNHMPITVNLDITRLSLKGDINIFPEKLSQLILKYIPREKIFTPRDLMRKNQKQRDFYLRNKENLQTSNESNESDQQFYENPAQALQQQGWPLLKDLEGKFIFVVTGKDYQINVEKTRQLFDQQIIDNSPYSISFVDIDSRSISDISKQFNPYRVFFNVQLQEPKIYYMNNLQEAQKRGFIIRAWKVENSKRWEFCKNNQINQFVTDFIYGSLWTVFN